MFRRLPMFFACALLACAAQADNLSLQSGPYLSGGLFSRPVLPVENETVLITVRPKVDGQAPKAVRARVSIRDARGETLLDRTVALQKRNDALQASVQWRPKRNGLYTVQAVVDPDGRIAESNENDNQASLLLPVTVQGRRLFFVWYREEPNLRWVNCITSVKSGARARLTERGVLALNWEFGGMSWRYYDKKKAQSEPAKVLADLEELFYRKYTNPSKGLVGFGIDETGGYAGSFTEQRSIASMKALIRAKKAMPKRFFAVWQGGGVRASLAQYYRNACDLLLLETYIWRAIPEDLRCDDVYRVISDRLDPFLRGNDMIVPSYGSPCHTLLAFDIAERPDKIDLGEQEEVVRFVRRYCPEMRGIAWYNGGLGGYGVKLTPQLKEHYRRLVANADRLFFDYYVKPCLTFLPHGLWVRAIGGGKWDMTAALSNIGGMDARGVSVRLSVDGKPLEATRLALVPAGKCRNDDRVFVRRRVSLRPGLHRFQACVTTAPNATILNGVIEAERVTP